MAEMKPEDHFFALAEEYLHVLWKVLEVLGKDISFIEPSAGAALVIAAFMGRVDLVELLFSKGVSVAQRIKTTHTALHAAACNGKTEVVEWLVYHGATLDCRDSFQQTPIIHACINGHVDTVRRLIEFGARVDLVDNNDMSALDICKCTCIPSAACIRKKKDCIPLIQEALEKKQLRCCNPKCGKPGYRSDLKLCGGCKLTRYCSRECQKHHWSVGHKKCCGKDKYSGPEPGDIHTIGYAILKAMIEAKSGEPFDICKCILCRN